MEKFELLLQCYKSGQMSEKQWQDHLRNDEGLAEWYVNILQNQQSKGASDCRIRFQKKVLDPSDSLWYDMRTVRREGRSQGHGATS